MGKTYDFDFIVIGSGPAGIKAAVGLAKQKRRVAIVEAAKLGGTRVNSRNIPLLASLKFSHLYHDTNMASKYGISQGAGPHFNMPTALNWQQNAVENASKLVKEELSGANVTIIRGFANFLSEHEIAVGDRKYTSSKFVIATGSKLKIREISGVESVPFFGPDGAITLRRLPKAVAVVGGGSAGCEIAQYFAELGTKVVLFERSERLLPDEDQEVGILLKERLSQKLGVIVLTNAKVVAIEKDSTSKRVVFTDGGNEKMVRIEEIILATGTEPALDLGLENADIKYKNSGIIVDSNMQTSNKNIYAIGDVVSTENSSTDRVVYQASIFLHNLSHHNSVEPDYRCLPRITNTNPVVATVGYTEDDLMRRDIKYNKSLVCLNAITASIVDDYRDGFIKIVTDKKGTVLGATIVTPNAELLIPELVLAVSHKMSAADLACIPHVAEGYGEIVRAAAKVLAEKIA